jgi:hypothetical protein
LELILAIHMRMQTYLVNIVISRHGQEQNGDVLACPSYERRKWQLGYLNLGLAQIKLPIQLLLARKRVLSYLGYGQDTGLRGPDITLQFSLGLRVAEIYLTVRL